MAPLKFDLKPASVAAMKRHKPLDGYPSFPAADTAQDQDRSANGNLQRCGDVVVRDGGLDGSSPIDEPHAVLLLQQLIQRGLHQILKQERFPDRRRQLCHVERPRLAIDKSQPLNLHDRVTNGNFQSVGHLIISRNDLPPAHFAAKVASPSTNVLEQAGKGLHQTLSDLGGGNIRSAPLDPFDDAFVLQLGQRLTYHRAADVVSPAELVVPWQPVPRDQAPRCDVRAHQLLQLVVIRQWRIAID